MTAVLYLTYNSWQCGLGPHTYGMGTLGPIPVVVVLFLLAVYLTCPLP